MAVLSAMVASLSTYYPETDDDKDVDQNIIRLLAKLKTIAAFSHKKAIGQAYIYPQNHLDYVADLGFTPDVQMTDANLYDPNYLEAAGPAADGTYSRIAIWPFEEADQNPATAQTRKLRR